MSLFQILSQPACQKMPEYLMYIFGYFIRIKIYVGGIIANFSQSAAFEAGDANYNNPFFFGIFGSFNDVWAVPGRRYQYQNIIFRRQIYQLLLKCLIIAIVI